MLELLDALLVAHAEALLLIHHQQAEIAKMDILREQAMGSDDDVYFTLRHSCQHFRNLFLVAKPAEHLHLHRERSEAALERLEVLERQHCGRSQDGNLFTITERLERGPHGDLRFAIAHVAA